MRHKDVEPTVATGSSGDRSAISRLRLLDFDDLFLLGHLLDGNTIAATAKQLGLTQPAITQRVRKIERVFDEAILQRVGRHVRLTKEGRAICAKAADALALMRAVTSEPATNVLTVGADAAAGISWLTPAALDLRATSPDLLFHTYIGAPEELSSLLDSGSLDAYLSTLPYTGAQHSVLDVGEEEYVFVARKDVAASIHTPADLTGVVLLELDRSYPLLGRVEATARAGIRFQRVWFLGAVAAALQAALQGYGVAILPHALVRAGLAAGKLSVILPELELTPDRLRLIYRQDRDLAALISPLAERLRARR